MFEKIINTLRKTLPKKSHIRASYLYKIFGDRIFHSNLWRFNKKSFSKGLAFGIFIGFTPTIPLHTFLAALGSIYFDINLPAAILGCWVTNPVTLYFVFRYEMMVGKGIMLFLGDIFSFVKDFFQSKLFKNNLYLNVAYMWVGSIVIAPLMSLLTYYMSNGIWRYISILRWQRRRNRKLNCSEKKQ